METERNQLTVEDYEERNRNASSRYMEDSRRQYLLASNTESLQALTEKQQDELTRVLIELKSEYDLLTRETSTKKKLIEEYNKKINMIQHANNVNEKKQEEKKESTNHIKEGIELKKNKKNEELYQKKTLSKQVDKLNKDLFLIQKEIVKNENESVLLDKKKERAKLDENIIKEKGNQVYSKIEEQRMKNERNRNENDLQKQYYEQVITQKKTFMEFADERKESQKNIEQKAKNDAQDKQERDICGTQDIESIINFIMLRNKRYNYSVQVVTEKENQVNSLRNDIKRLKSHLVKLKNEIIVNEKESNSKTETTIAESGMEKTELDLVQIEKEKNQELLVLGKKYNEVNLSYNRVLENIKEMQEYDKNHPLDLKEKEEEEKKEEQENIGNKNEDFQLTAEEEECINGYEKFLEKILKAFNILCLCKSKQEFLSLMREKGIAQQTDNKTTLNKTRGKARRTARKSFLKTTKIKVEEPVKNNEGDEEEDLSNYEMDKNILTRFMKEQKKEIDEFINVKKGEVRKPPANK